MTLDDFLAGYADDPERLDRDLSQWAHTAPGCAWLVSLMREDDALIGEGIIRKVLACWGFGGASDLDGVHNFAVALRPPVDTATLYSLLAPRLVLDTSRWHQQQSFEYRDAFLSQHLHASDMQVFPVDRWIPMIPESDISVIAAWWRQASIGFNYIPEGGKGKGGDCDDWALFLRSELAKQGYPGLMQVIRTGGHVFNAVWLTNGNIVLIEPQDLSIQARGYTGPAVGLIW